MHLQAGIRPEGGGRGNVRQFYLLVWGERGVIFCDLCSYHYTITWYVLPTRTNKLGVQLCVFTVLCSGFPPQYGEKDHIHTYTP